EAAAALSQMAARQAKGSSPLAPLLRERQDLVGEWQKRDGVRSAAVSQAPDKRKRNAQAEAANVARLAAIDKRIAAIDKRLEADFPDYAALSRPEPLAVDDVQRPCLAQPKRSCCCSIHRNGSRRRKKRSSGS
ncbi:MAG: hypothetical protein ABUJ98_15100, partial [Hyphomicrobium sp.]